MQVLLVLYDFIKKRKLSKGMVRRIGGRSECRYHPASFLAMKTEGMTVSPCEMDIYNVCLEDSAKQRPMLMQSPGRKRVSSCLEGGKNVGDPSFSDGLWTEDAQAPGKRAKIGETNSLSCNFFPTMHCLLLQSLPGGAAKIFTKLISCPDVSQADDC